MRFRKTLHRFWQGCRIEEKIVLIFGTIFLLLCAGYLAQKQQTVFQQTAPFFEPAPDEKP